MVDEKKRDHVLTALDPDIYTKLNFCKVLDSRKNESGLTWNQFSAQLPLQNQWQAQSRNLSWIDGLFSTHPVTGKRNEELENLHHLLQENDEQRIYQ